MTKKNKKLQAEVERRRKHEREQRSQKAKAKGRTNLDAVPGSGLAPEAPVVESGPAVDEVVPEGAPAGVGESDGVEVPAAEAPVVARTVAEVQGLTGHLGDLNQAMGVVESVIADAHAEVGSVATVLGELQDVLKVAIRACRPKGARASRAPGVPRGPSLLGLAAEVLGEAGGEPIRVKAILDGVLARGWTSTGKTPEATLAAGMYTEVKRRGAESRFAVAGRGLWVAGARQVA